MSLRLQRVKMGTTLNLSPFTVLSKCHFCTDPATSTACIWQCWGFMLSCSLTTSLHSLISPAFPPVQFGSSKLARQAIRELYQTLAQMIFAVPLPAGMNHQVSSIICSMNPNFVALASFWWIWHLINSMHMFQSTNLCLSRVWYI